MGIPTLIVNADDFGASQGTTDGIVRAFREGIVTSTSILVTTPAFSYAVKAASDCPGLGIGLHFTLTVGRSAAPKEDVPLLVDEKGFFDKSFSKLLIALWLGKSEPLLIEIKRELQAQLERMKKAGLKPDHINGERHIHLIPAIFKIVALVAREENIPYVRLIRDAGWRYLRVRDVFHYLLSGGFLKSILLESLSGACRQTLPPGVSAVDHYATLFYTGRMDLVMERLLAAPPAGLTEIAVHPGFVRNEETGTGNKDLEKYLSSPDRELELKACLNAKDKSQMRFVRFSDVQS